MTTMADTLPDDPGTLKAMLLAERARAERLEDGAFRWPNMQDGIIHLTAAQLSALLEGLDWRRVHSVRETVAPAQPS